MADALTPDTIVIVTVMQGTPDEDGVPTDVTVRTTVHGCAVLPVGAQPAGMADDRTSTAALKTRVIVAPEGTAAREGDKVEALGEVWRVDADAVQLPDPYGLIGHTEIYVRRWS